MSRSSYRTWIGWRFELRGFYDRPVAAEHRDCSTWDDLLTAWQVRCGTVTLRHGRGGTTAATGDWLLIPPGLSRHHRFSADAAIRSVRCLVSDGHGHPIGSGSPPLLLQGGASDLDAAADVLARVVPAPDFQDWHELPLPPPSWAAVQGAVLAWGAAAIIRMGIDPRPPPEPRVAAAQALLLARPGPGPIPWTALRERTGLSRPQLDRLFRQHSGGSVRAWLGGRMLAEACAALADQREPIKAIASRLGFPDPSHFSRWFQAGTGTRPQRWRRQPGA